MVVFAEGFFAYYSVEYVLKLYLQGCSGYYFGQAPRIARF